MSRAVVGKACAKVNPAGTASFAVILQRSRALRHGIRAAVRLKPRRISRTDFAAPAVSTVSRSKIRKVC
jgi:hypothetical protein